MENGAASDGKDPSGFLSEILGAPVTVKLNSGVVYKGQSVSHRFLSASRLSFRGWTGELQSVDGYMNIALEKTEEHVDGKLRRNYGDAFVRGNNGQPSYITIPILLQLTHSTYSYVYLLGFVTTTLSLGECKDCAGAAHSTD